MNRRRLLANASIAVTAPLTGCLGSSEPGFDRETVSGSPEREFPCPASATDGTVDAVSDESPEARRRLVEPWARNDVPPYPIRKPEAEAEAEWNPDYLGEHMPTTPSLEFEQHAFAFRTDDPAAYEPVDGPWSYVVDLFTESDRSTVLDVDLLAPRIRERLAAVDYGSNVAVVFVDCCGMEPSGHRWARVEATPSGVRLHGYHTEAWGGDLIPRTRLSILEIEQLDTAVEHACVSYTAQEPTRLHAASTDGHVTFLPAVLANDHDSDLEVDLQLTTETGERRVDRTVTAFADREWNAIGVVGLVDEAFTVQVAVERLGIDVTETYAGDFALGIRLRPDGGVAVGPSNEI